MRVEVDHATHHVVLTGDRGSEIVLTWAAALNLGSLLIQKAEEAEPAPKGKTYMPTAGRWG